MTTSPSIERVSGSNVVITCASMELISISLVDKSRRSNGQHKAKTKNPKK